ncbi:MAG: LysE family translocator [Gammaproteobacteria bacterium]|jgi:threonine/homoserine/homoserine lactone efflux protein|uniref:Threonine/homoserine/homoserine lactone efflux protein n=1 Tax=Marinomonas polaris DSM 16579 TaxID=1122206 RepID=A0A1M5ILE6_9GAMM|nr:MULTISPECIES: LysE family translocator [Marinomonas]MBU1294053.1 LysE family translocator [Gammaproteobacteria bacterium]MBU1465011.1 LysE family translocator [Gammaproteobacteria bacterium]MBU2021474.1 LysE family translocator [Gammaproteobacteria bacterium]MBU2240659.1 LysE family translocator [Gammaproteobacteria bacterium]MBU2317900.1 LysE family translocator [Gammaproteobacteria bacterium]|tara:strand:+ start:4562 stop:5182 length:621 start_codon:yes stop_codon:yes gene_type:complete
MTLESGITFFIAIFIFSITPGPGIFAILARSISRGARASFSLSLGMVMSDIVYLVMACYGLAAIASAWEEVFLIIRYAGAAYLIYLGWKMWISPVSTVSSGDNLQDANNEMASFIQGFMISASNPKVILFYVAFLPTFMDLTVLSASDIVLASFLTFVALLLGLTIISVGASQARRFMKSERSMKTLNRTAGGIMASAGAFLALKG